MFMHIIKDGETHKNPNEMKCYFFICLRVWGWRLVLLLMHHGLLNIDPQLVTKKPKVMLISDRPARKELGDSVSVNAVIKRGKSLKTIVDSSSSKVTTF